MEIRKLKEVPPEKLPEEHLKWASEMTELFKRGVKEAKAENARLGLTTDEKVDYSTTEVGAIEAPFVSESEDE